MTSAFHEFELEFAITSFHPQMATVTIIGTLRKMDADVNPIGNSSLIRIAGAS